MKSILSQYRNRKCVPVAESPSRPPRNMDRLVCRPAYGFTMVELCFTVALLGIVLAIATPSIRGYIDNSNLKSAARTVSGDLAYLREAAMTEYNNGTKYCMKFDMGTNTISLLYDNGGTLLPVVNYPSTRVMSDFGSSIQITSVPSGSSWVKVYQRGFIGNTGDIEITNSRGSKARITLVATGRAYVTYSMQ